MRRDRLVVMMRLTNGDTLMSSTATFNRAELERDMRQRMSGKMDDLLYFTVRVTRNDVKSNYKAVTVADLEAVLDGVFSQV